MEDVFLVEVGHGRGQLLPVAKQLHLGHITAVQCIQHASWDVLLRGGGGGRGRREGGKGEKEDHNMT